jgi:hypothetical protein
MGATMHRDGQLSKVAAAYELAIVDCPPRHGEIQRSALLVADLAILPCGPAAVDAWALGASIDLVQETRTLRRDLAAYVLITRKQTRTALGQGAREVLSTSGLPVLQAELGYRIAYQEAIAAGSGTSRSSTRARRHVEDRSLGAAHHVDTVRPLYRRRARLSGSDAASEVRQIERRRPHGWTWRSHEEGLVDDGCGRRVPRGCEPRRLRPVRRERRRLDLVLVEQLYLVERQRIHRVQAGGQAVPGECAAELRWERAVAERCGLLDGSACLHRGGVYHAAKLRRPRIDVRSRQQ